MGLSCLLACAFLLGGCIYDGLVIADEGFSLGPGRDGALHNATRLPAEGDGYWIPPTWSDRGLNFGVDELASVLVYTGRRLKMHDENLVLGVGDLSRVYGGRSPWHRSHQTGRDVDLLFFVRDGSGALAVSETMFHHKPDGSQKTSGSQDKNSYTFDVEANWLLVAALVDNPIAEVQYIFVQDDLRQMLLEHAAEAGVDAELRARAALVMKQPGDSAPHDDHMHVRIFCPKNDLGPGCVDFGQMRWHKRDYKYEGRVERLPGYDSMVPPLAVTALPWLFR